MARDAGPGDAAGWPPRSVQKVERDRRIAALAARSEALIDRWAVLRTHRRRAERALADGRHHLRLR